MAVRHGRLAFADEKPYDRDTAGVLWTRTPSIPGKGRPEFGAVHSLRQRQAMTGLLCQVCGQPADRDSQGVLWLMGEDPTGSGEVLTTHPPVCVSCALASVVACPHLRRHYVALRVRSFRPAGVRGALYRPAVPSPVAVDAVGVEYDDPAIRWVRAGQLIMRLTDYTVVDLERGSATPATRIRDH